MKKILSLTLVLVMVLTLFAACKKDDEGSADKTYTYNLAMGTFSSNWNPHTYETATDGTILDYLSDGFYTFDYNEDETGFEMGPSMVKDDHPVDITAEYVGKYGIKEGDSKMVWKINLREDLKWQNGDAITAHDFVESAKRLLNPVAKNYRADSMYSGSVVIYGAQEYFKQGQSGWFPADGPYTTYSADLDEMIIFSLAAPSDDIPVEASVRTAMGFPASYDAAACAAYLIGSYLGECAFTAETAAAMEGKTMAEIKADATLKAAWDALIGWWQTEPDEELDFFVTNYTYPELAWEENVGIFALSDYELVYVITKPLDGFYLKYGMPSGYLVHIPTYDACASVDENGNYINTYNTSVETSMSYGPYNLTNYIADKVYDFERSTTWCNLTDDTYMTTNINIQYVPEAATRLNLLKEGKLDSYGLSKEDVATYGKSDHTYYSEGASTFALTFNPDLAALQTAQENAGENKNKTIISLVEFRQAISFGLDRSAFAAATSPLNSPCFGLYSNQHIVDPETGVGYRSTEQAKDVLVKFWGLEDQIGEGKLYADKDAAIASLTGYQPDAAKAKFNEAYQKAIAEGLMDEDDVIEITIGIPNPESSFYNNGYEFIVNNYTELVKGTDLEGKLTFNRDDTVGNDFASALQSNQVQLLFGVGWSGMELDPYGLMQAYVTPNYQYDAITDFTAISLGIEIDGTVYTASAYDWYLIINGETVDVHDAEGNAMAFTCGSTAGKTDLRLYILSKLEETVLMNYNFIPAIGDAGATIKGMQLKYYHEEYMFGMGFGGIKYMTYNYTDAEWDAYVKAQGGTLDYT